MTVLVLEDDVQVRSSIVAMLEYLGHQSATASDAGGMTELLMEQTPSLLMVDIVLGQSDGISLANRVLEKHPGLPVIVMSGVDHRQRLEQLKNAGDSVFLIKPFGPEELQSTLASLLR